MIASELVYVMKCSFAAVSLVWEEDNPFLWIFFTFLLLILWWRWKGIPYFHHFAWKLRSLKGSSYLDWSFTFITEFSLAAFNAVLCRMHDNIFEGSYLIVSTVPWNLLMAAERSIKYLSRGFFHLVTRWIPNIKIIDCSIKLLALNWLRIAPFAQMERNCWQWVV